MFELKGHIMKLIVGLGNPETKYEKTRHNIGFEIVDYLQKKLMVSSGKEKFQGILSEKNIAGEKILFLKPQTYMNLSGNSVIEVVNFYKINPKKDMIIVYDDMDLELGNLRIKEKGSSGGHNGIKSIISHLGDEFLRVKCGIGKAKGENTINFVLGKFTKDEEENVEHMKERATECLLEMIKENDLAKVMQKYNNKIKTIKKGGKINE